MGTSSAGREHKQAVRAYYARRANDYDSQKRRTWKSTLGFDTTIVATILNNLAHTNPKLGLDVGFGTGRVGLPLLNNMSIRLVGMDLSKEMTHVALEKTRGQRELYLVVGDGDWIPFSNAMFDCVLCISVSHYFLSLHGFISELRRVSRDKALLVLGDVTLHELDVENYLNKLESALSPVHFRYYRPTELRELLQRHGFEPIVTETITYNKTFKALIDDKAKYFEGRTANFWDILEKASVEARRIYEIRSDQLTLFYTLVFARARFIQRKTVSMLSKMTKP